MTSVHLDFETRSLVDVKETGSWRYSMDPSTVPLCLCYTIDDQDVRTITFDDFNNTYDVFGDQYYTPNMQKLHELALDETVIFKAHNSMFEYCMWNNVLHKRYGFADLKDLKRWDCTAAKAASHALPRSLGECALALKLSENKDETGKRVMLQLSKPRKPSKNDPSIWVNDKEKFNTLYDYCRQDVIVERAIDNSLPNLNKQEKAIWELDQAINSRGIKIDTKALDIALNFINEFKERLNIELQDLTSGAVDKATETKRMTDYLRSHIPITDLRKSTVEDWIKNVDNPKLKRVLEIRSQGGKSSTAKLESIKSRVCEDGRVRDILVYHGASTGRWAGAGIQVQNFPRGVGYNSDMVLDCILLNDLDAFEMMYPDVINAISAGLRGFIIAEDGCDFVTADFAQIEARVVMMLAGCKSGIDDFKHGRDIYLSLAQDIYKRPLTKANKDERQLGKVGVLGCGFQMGAARFKEHAKNQAGLIISEETAEKTVNAYRTKYPEVVKLWYAQERAAILATKNPGRLYEEGPIKWKVQGNFLYCKLPSGRCLAYPDPMVKIIKTKWDTEKESLTFMAVNGLTKKWEREHTYGGKLVENIVQATARDLMANGMLNTEKAGYKTVMTVHDEVISEVPEGFGSVEEFEKLLSTPPEWAKDYPIKAEGWRGKRYRK